MLKNKIKSTHDIQKGIVVKKKAVKNKKTLFPKYKIYLIIICMLFGFCSLILLPKYLNNNLYADIVFYIFLLFSVIVIFTDKYIINKIKLLLGYIKDATFELSKIVWPNKKAAMAMTLMVIVFVAILSLFIWGVDSLVSWLFYDILLKR